MSSIKWTQAHQREATARQWELAAECLRAGRYAAAQHLGYCPESDAESEGKWRLTLAEDGYSEHRVDLEVRRVDRLARGLLVRTTTDRVYYRALDEDGKCLAPGNTPKEARERVKQHWGKKCKVAKVVKIREHKVTVRKPWPDES